MTTTASGIYKPNPLRTAIIIPARMQATRLPGKPLAELGNLPVVVHVARQAQRCPGVDVVAVATDSPDIALAVRAQNIAAVMTSQHHASGTDRVAEAAEILAAQWVINVQGDEPFIDPNDLYAILTTLRQGRADIVTLKRPLHSVEDLQNPSVVKVVTRDDGMALYFSRAPIPFDRHGAHQPTGCFAHVGVYGFRQSSLKAMCTAPPHSLEVREGLEQLRALAMGLSIAVLPAKTVARGIDTVEDLHWARATVARLGNAAFAEFNNLSCKEA